MLLSADSSVSERFVILDWLEGLQMSPFLLMVALCLGTLVSEDLACIAGGMIAAKGWLPLEGAIAACAAGIWIGDLGLYGVGCLLGQERKRWSWLSRLVNPSRIERGKHMFDRYGLWWIAISRFLPGMRLPTYVAAGMVGWSFKTCLVVLAIAVWIWTPILCGLSFYAGRVALEWVETYQEWAWPVAIVLVLAILGMEKLIVPAFTWRGRRLLKARWLRLRRWTFRRKRRSH